MSCSEAGLSPSSPFSLSRLVHANLEALCLARSRPLSLLENCLLGLVHGAGLLAAWRALSWPFTYVAAAGVLVLLLALVLLRAWRLSLAWLAPWFAVYAVLGIRFIVLRWLGGSLPGYYDYLPPDWSVPPLHLQAAALAALLYSLAIVAAQMVERPVRLLPAAAALLASAAVVWAAIAYVNGRTHGATGSDPYAYVQMGIDWARRGVPIHRFDLFPEYLDSTIPWYPLLHVGYHLPFNAQGDAVTVWPPGGALAYAAAWKLGGEAMLYWVNPLFSFLSVLAAGLLARELLAGMPAARRGLAAALTLFLVATSREQVVWAGVTMADAQAEFFSLAAFILALRARRNAAAPWPLLAGAALGAAYDIRHTQLVLAIPLALLFVSNSKPVKARLGALALGGAAALALALPDLWYHQAYLGGWLVPESEELALFSINGIGGTSVRLYQALFAADEFGWLIPFFVVGAWQAARTLKVEFWALAAWLALSLAVHLPYAALRLRDLLPEIPAIAFLASFGLVTLAQGLLSRRSAGARLAAALVIFAGIGLLALRVWNTVPLAGQTVRPIFGYVTEEQRAAFNQLAVETRGNALIGATLNSGAVEWYTGHPSFRPDAWNAPDLAAFLQGALQRHEAVYILEDSRAVDAALDGLRANFAVTPVTRFAVPLFGDGSPDSPGMLWRIDHR